MNTNDYCSGCRQKETCRQAYEKLGCYQGPNIAWKAIRAFVVPIAIFVASAAGANLLFQRYFEGTSLTLVCFVGAVSITTAAVFLFYRRPKKDIADKR